MLSWTMHGIELTQVIHITSNEVGILKIHFRQHYCAIDIHLCSPSLNNLRLSRIRGLQPYTAQNQRAETAGSAALEVMASTLEAVLVTGTAVAVAVISVNVVAVMVGSSDG